MPSPAPSPPNDTTGMAASSQPTVNLQIVSPSVGVTRPLSFPALDASTTIKQLKGKIRDVLPMRPEDQNQRLIWRGRAIMRDTDTLLDIFGPALIRDFDQQTIHLVIKNTADPNVANTLPTSMPPTTPLPPLPSPSTSQPPRSVPGPRVMNGLPPPPGHGFPVRNPWDPAPGAQPNTPENPHAMSDWLRDVASRSSQSQARAMNEARGRMPGVPSPNRLSEMSTARASSAPGHTIYRETIGPHGRTFQVQTVQTIVHNSNRRRNEHQQPDEVRRNPGPRESATEANFAPGQLQRSASSASLHNRAFPQNASTLSVQSPGVGRGPMIDPSMWPSMGGGRQTPWGARPPQQVNSNASSHAMEVYIVSSPEGPRFLLVNNSTAEQFYTTQARGFPGLPPLPGGYQLPQPAGIPGWTMPPNYNALLNQPSRQIPTMPAPAYQVSGVDGQPTPTHQPNQAVAQPAPAPEPEQPVPAPAFRHPQNPVVAAIPLMLVQMWPHLWAMVRAALFFWVVVRSDSIWIRWTYIIGLSLLSVLFSTGALNNMARRMWEPLSHYVDHILPGFERPHGVTADDGQGRQRADTDTLPAGPDPGQMAARLVADRHTRQDRWLRHLRRFERASLLFLASIAPGIAERHIANLEAEARVAREREERQRREAAEAAEAAAREAESKDAGGDKAQEAVSSQEIGDSEAPSGESSHQGQEMTTKSNIPEEDQGQTAHATEGESSRIHAS